MNRCLRLERLKLSLVHPFPLLAAAALFSGAALVLHILARVSLALAVLGAGGLMALVVGSIWRRCKPAVRGVLLRHVRTGVLCGATATAAYDLAKFALSRWDPSPYNPFEAVRIFGVLLAGSSAPAPAIYAVGTTFHLANGICFGVAYCLLLGRRGLVAGIAWGLLLELFQLTLYPGWLDIRFYREFATISALSHVVYGSVLGAGCRYGLGPAPDRARLPRPSLEEQP